MQINNGMCQRRLWSLPLMLIASCKASNCNTVTAGGMYASMRPQNMGAAPEKKIGKRKISIEFIDDKGKRSITFSKRKAGLMKKVPHQFFDKASSASVSNNIFDRPMSLAH